MANSSLNVNITIVVTFLAGLVLFVSKLKFVFKIFDSKAQVTVFNYSLALRLVASGLACGEFDKNLLTLQNIR